MRNRIVPGPAVRAWLTELACAIADAEDYLERGETVPEWLAVQIECRQVVLKAEAESDDSLSRNTHHS